MRGRRHGRDEGQTAVWGERYLSLLRLGRVCLAGDLRVCCPRPVWGVFHRVHPVPVAGEGGGVPDRSSLPAAGFSFRRLC